MDITFGATMAKHPQQDSQSASLEEMQTQIGTETSRSGWPFKQIDRL
jgi:hypothetical protein